VKTHAEILQRALQRIGQCLPPQNPLPTFIHLNLLTAWEDKPFWEGVEEAANLYRAKPYLHLEFYLHEFERGRISKQSFAKSCTAWLQDKDPWLTHTEQSRESSVVCEMLLQLGTSFTPRLLQEGASFDSVRTFILEQNPTLQAAIEGSYAIPLSVVHPHLLPDVLAGSPLHTGISELARLVESFMDQGVSPWDNPFATGKFSSYVSAFFSSKGWLLPSWQKRWAQELRKIESLDPLVALENTLLRFHCPPAQWENLLLEVSFLLKGWMGIINRLEQDPTTAPVRIRPLSVCELLTVLLLLLESCHTKLHLKTPPHSSRSVPKKSILGFFLHHFFLSYSDTDLRTWGWKLDFPLLLERFSQLTRNRLRQIWHEAYENELYGKTLGLIQATSATSPWIPPIQRKSTLPIHILFCMDDREESLRRNIEHIRPDIHTHGVLGSFGVDFQRQKKAGNPALSVEQKATKVAAFLHISSLINRLDGLVWLMAHSSTSTNNPFCQSYGCGACGGEPGGTNALRFSQMANDVEVRHALLQKGIKLPNTIWFLPAQHDTATDEITLLDKSPLPSPFQELLAQVKGDILQATQVNAYERIRRFPNAPFFYKKERALSHVKSRAHSLAEPRPEYGHTGIFLAVFGRRALTHPLFLDRRSFLISYEPDHDLEGQVLKNLLGAALPVCANINLDYFFSALDNHAFGAGSKLPTNISALLGIVTGGGGDLRIGLGTQMIEKHESIRCLTLVESPLPRLEAAIEHSPRLRQLVDNRWIRLACLDPSTKKILGYTPHGWNEIPLFSDTYMKNAPSSLYHARFEREPAQNRLHILSLGKGTV